ncbi:MAG: ABC transporter substrate-binding protein [Clostridiales bacterium]|nr:ABC transporter substrate-binding protein [Clostridiales bacterium]
MKRLLALILALTMMMCFAQLSAAATEEPVTVRYVIPGTGPSTIEGEPQKVWDAVNAKMAADGVGVQFQLTTIPWDAWDQKTTLMLASGEPFDLLHVMEDLKGFTSYVGQEALTPLDDLIAQYGSSLQAAIPESVWKGAKVNGVTYCVPAFWVENTESCEAITMRTDWLAEYGLEAPKTAEDLLNTMAVYAEKWTGEGKPYIMQLYAEPARYLYRTFDTYPFTVFEQLICIRQDGTVEFWLETEEFKKEAEFARACFDAGYVNPDILSVPSDWRNDEMELGRYLYRDGTGLRSTQDMEKQGVQEDLILLAPEKKTFRDGAFRNDNVVPAASEHPEAAVKFLNWLYGSQENFDLFVYGIEGQHYTIVDAENGTYQNIQNAEGSNLYLFDTWMIGSLNYMRVSSIEHPTKIRTHFTYDEAAENSVALGFQFDPSDVSVAYANCLAEVKASLYPMKVGIQTYEDGIDKARANFEAAGVASVVEAYQAQLTAWLEANG